MGAIHKSAFAKHGSQRIAVVACLPSPPPNLANIALVAKRKGVREPISLTISAFQPVIQHAACAE
eukprot:3250498-Amphidinium_carterae.1